ncbi:tyrosine--tRNA ligase [Candidatus Gottesmanbacteria bacterium]|nr:tyrosine--tRNA ligase [Candidatus Gottesmanbacteria bacterium]
MNTKVTQIDHVLTRGVQEIIGKDKIITMLHAGKPLRIKYGIDPTATSFHLGHTVPLRKLKEFQELGHTAVFIIGDYTAQIGDPVGKSETRTMLTLKQTQDNAKEFTHLAAKFMDIEKAEVHFQSSWYNSITLEQTIRLMATVTKEQLMRHETFRMREREGKPLGFHEMFYTLLMAFDSVAVKADIELGGPDQKFNFLVTRQVMERYSLKAQEALLLRYLPGTDGAEKMSKSTNNFVGLDEDPLVQLVKLMKIRDENIPTFFDLLTDSTVQPNEHPIAAKRRLAKLIVSDCHDRSAAKTADQQFFAGHPQLKNML